MNHADPQNPNRQDISFTSQGITCRGWLTYPAPAKDQDVPLVILGHGFSGTREMHLEQYAERFVAAGMAALIFDYRHFGASDGEPRNCLIPSREVEDWHAALAFARQLPGIDTKRIALWGTSFGGGLVVTVAAQDGNVAATVSQCPMLDGLASALEIGRYAGPASLMQVSLHGLLDAARSVAGMSPHYIPVVARTGETGAMTSEDAWEGYMNLCPPGFRNEVTARTGLLVPMFRPIRYAAQVKCPALLQICTKDSVAPASAAEKAAKKISKAEVVRYDIGHFDVYFGDAFERSVGDQLAFLKKHLKPA